MSLNSGDAASPVAFLSDWTVEYRQNVFDVTTVTDVQIVHAAGFPDASGSFAGFYDSATAQSYVAAVDGLPRNMYLYPSTAQPGTVFSGMVLPDYSIGGGVTAAVSLSAKWSASGPVTQTSTGTASAGLASGAGTAQPARGPLGTGFTSVPGLAVPGRFTPGSPG